MQASELQPEAKGHHSPDQSPEHDLSNRTNYEPETSDGDERSTLSKDEIFGILSNPRRRAALHYLNAHDGETVELRGIAEQLAAWENDVPVEAVTYKQRKRVYTSLYQSHLPRMDAMGIIRFDKHRGTVDGTAWTHELEQYLEELEDDSNSRRYATLAATAFCFGLPATAWLGLVPIGLGTTVGFALGIGITMLAAFAMQRFRNH